MLKTALAPLFAATALALSVPAHAAGSEDRARTAIAAAQAKIETAERLGAGVELPGEAAEARAALALAREHFEADRNTRSIEQAVRAQALAETALGRMQNRNEQAVADERAARDAEVSAATQQSLDAQQSAADANARAAAAERSAAASAAEAQAARNQAAAAQVETTVTTQQPVRASTPRRSTKTTVTRRTVKPATSTSGQVTTTTTVTQPPR